MTSLPPHSEPLIMLRVVVRDGEPRLIKVKNHAKKAKNDNDFRMAFR